MFRKFVPTRTAAAAALTILPAAGVAAYLSAGSADAASRVQQYCISKENDLGGYHRRHGWCSNGIPTLVQVRCANGAVHTSSYARKGYNKAECHIKREGRIVDYAVGTPVYVR